jgi:SAM-dependent methyltransferase
MPSIGSNPIPALTGTPIQMAGHSVSAHEHPKSSLDHHPNPGFKVMREASTKLIRESYDELAKEYARRVGDELRHKPFDRAQLLKFSIETRGNGPICDLGCGPGHVAQFLRDAGSDVFGLDISPRMIQEARRLNPGLNFCEGDMLALHLGNETLAGIVSFYSIVNLSEPCLGIVFDEMARVLKTGALALIAFHVGNEAIELSELWGHPVTLKFSFFQPSRVCEFIEDAGLAIEGIWEREPYEPGVEHQSRRAYILARKPNDCRRIPDAGLLRV